MKETRRIANNKERRAYLTPEVPKSLWRILEIWVQWVGFYDLNFDMIS